MGEKILLTGGTGSFGHAYVRKRLERDDVELIRIFSRDEMKQWEMANLFEDERLEFVLGDVRDGLALRTAIRGCNHVVHAAATKIVPLAELNPWECIKTNVIGGHNVIEAAAQERVDSCVALSTDKASSPSNLYGASKLASDKLFIAANSKFDTNFSVVRYGNVISSRGSVIPFFTSLDRSLPTPITDARMTRFFITLEQAVEAVDLAQNCASGCIFVKKLPVLKVVDLAKVLRPWAEIRIIGRRPGEKIHEQMIGAEDDWCTIEFDDYFLIAASRMEAEKIIASNGGSFVKEGFVYSSGESQYFINERQISELLKSCIGLP